MKTAFLLGSLLHTLLITAQSWKDKQPTFRPYTISVKETLPSDLKDELKDIHYLDARPDSSKLGFIPIGVSSFHKIITDQSIKTIFAADSTTDTKSDTSLAYFFVVRQLWLKQTTLDEEAGNKISHESVDDNRPFGKCTAKIEVYVIKNNTYYPLFRVDTVFTSRKSLGASLSNLIWAPFRFCTNRLKSQDWSSVLQRRKPMSRNDVLAFSNEKKIGLQQKMASLHKGVFYKFADFVSNNADTTSLSVQKGNLTDELIVSSNSSSQLVEDFWGYYDGKQLFVKIGYNLFPAFPVQNTFEFWGASSVEQRYGESGPVRANNGQDLAVGAVSRLLSSNKLYVRLKPMKLSMESGEIY